MDSGDKGAEQAAHRKGDKGGRADASAKATGGSANILINGRPAMRMSDAYEDGSVLIEGASSVLFNGKPAGRILSPTSSGGIVITGSSNVVIGDDKGDGSYASYLSPSGGTVAEKTQQTASPCQSTQKRVQEEVERIKNDYDREVEKHGRSMSIFYGFKTPEMIEKYLMPSQYREINKAITQAYGKLVEDAPYLPWARVGHIVTAQFGCRMKDMEWMTGVVPTNVLADEIDNAVRAIGEGNIRIFDGLYPTMRLVADLGPEKFLDCVRNNQFNPQPPEELIEAIEKLQQGKFQEAEKMIIDYEQREIAPPIYREFKPQYEFM